MSEAGRVLLRRTCGLGDLILSIPLLIGVRVVHSGAEVDFLGHGEHAQLLERLGVVDKGFPEEGSGWHELFSAKGTMRTRLRPDPTGYRHVYVVHTGAAIRELMLSLESMGVPYLHHIHAQPPKSSGMSVSSFQLDQLHLDPQAKLKVWKEMEGLAQRMGEDRSCEGSAYPVFAVHPGSGSHLKNWPVERFCGLLSALNDLWPWRVLVIGGPSDSATLTLLMEALGRSGNRLPHILFPGSLEELVETISGCSFFLGNDSGVTHLAALLGKETFAIFGPSDPVVWRPLGPKVRVITQHQLCRPCHPGGPKTCEQASCTRFPSVQQVLHEIEEALLM